MSRIFVYKNNARYGGGDWEDFFDNPTDGEWGQDDLAEHMKSGDYILAYQSDRQAAIGLCKFMGHKPLDDDSPAIYMRPFRRFTSPLSLEELRAVAPNAFKQGYVKTIYDLPADQGARLIELCLKTPFTDCTYYDDEADTDPNYPRGELAETMAFFLIERHFRSQGWEVTFTDLAEVDYHLLCKRGEERLELFVAPVFPDELEFIIADQEWIRLREKPFARLALVLDALGVSPTIKMYAPEEVTCQFEVTPTVYSVRPKSL